MDVSPNRGTPKSWILIGFSIINHPFWGTPILGNTQIPNVWRFWKPITAFRKGLEPPSHAFVLSREHSKQIAGIVAASFAKRWSSAGAKDPKCNSPVLIKAVRNFEKWTCWAEKKAQFWTFSNEQPAGLKGFSFKLSWTKEKRKLVPLRAFRMASFVTGRGRISLLGRDP